MPFPTPEWPPIQELDSIDLTGERHDGGLDLIIVVSQPLDDSSQTLASIQQKVATYLTAIEMDEFQAEMGHPPRDKTEIIVFCQHPIHPTALTVLGQCRATARARGVKLQVQAGPNAPPIALPEGGNELEQSIRPATASDQSAISSRMETVLQILRRHYGDVLLRQSEDDLKLLQRLHDDGVLHELGKVELGGVGIVFGSVLANCLRLEWVTVDWQGKRLFSLQYPSTSILLFPESMISKRIGEGQKVDFVGLFHAVASQVEQMCGDPDYQR